MSRRSKKNTRADGSATEAADLTDASEPIASESELLDLLASELNADGPDDASAARIADLERRLSERNSLVEILTERLEQAADQIDRLQRTGGALKNETPDGLPPEFFSEHRELARQLNSFYSAWEERYEGPSLRRIEASLADLTERIEQLNQSGTGPYGTESRAAAPVTSFLARASETDSASPSEEAGTGSDSADDEASPGDVPSEPSSGTARTVPATGPAGRIEIVLLAPTDECSDEDVPLPAAIDLEAATPGDLRDAVVERDQYLHWLCQKVRTIATRLESWFRHQEQQQGDSPSSQQFGELRSLIHSQIQILEVELSIERAKLFREQARLEQEQERLTRERDLIERDRSSSAGSDGDTALMKRWKRFIRPE